MPRFPRTVTLEEAFRRKLRAIYPARPALADEIQIQDWDYYHDERWWFETNLTSDEIIAVNKAFELLHEGVARERLRLRGVLDPSEPRDDIEPADARVGKLHIVAGELLVFLNNKLVKTYRQVECYETDVDRCVSDLRSETKHAKVRKLKGDDIPEFVKNYLDSEPKPTLTGIRNKWSDAGHGAQARELLDGEYRKQAEDRGISLKRGPKRILQK
jgi:hypothetical protein